MPLKAIQVLSHCGSGIMKQDHGNSMIHRQETGYEFGIGRPFFSLMFSLKIADSRFNRRYPWRISSHDLYNNIYE